MNKAKIYYYKVDDSFSKKEKLNFLKEKEHIGNIEWQEITPDQNNNWLTDDLQADFESFIPLGSKEGKASKILETKTIFKNYGRGVATCRDTWAYNFNSDDLADNIQKMISTYNQEVNRWNQKNSQAIKIDDFVINDDSKISW